VSTPDFSRVARDAAQAVVAVIDWTRTQPWADTSRILLEGQSAGGLTAVELGGMDLPGVKGYINFAGGTGANVEHTPSESCRPDLLTEYYRAVGQHTHVPSIWLYASNDIHWGPTAPKLWYAAFAAGGSATQSVFTGPVAGHDGHYLSHYGIDMWREGVEHFVKSLGF
jgi:dienelactone hydrolase